MKTRRILTVALPVLAGIAILPASLKAMMVSGPSDAPTLLLGDQVLVNMGAYRVNFPYTGWTLWRRPGPARGDMVMFHVPNRGMRGLKRVIGLPGDTVELRENVVYVNGQAIEQEPLNRASFAPWISSEHKLGQRVMREGRHWIAYSPGQSDLRTMPAAAVPSGLRSNRPRRMMPEW